MKSWNALANSAGNGIIFKVRLNFAVNRSGSGNSLIPPVDIICCNMKHKRKL